MDMSSVAPQPVTHADVQDAARQIAGHVRETPMTSAGELGGNVGRVEGGSAFVGWPGAPGWTTTGVCCAATESDNKHKRAQPRIS